MAEITLSNGKRVMVDYADVKTLNCMHWYESGGVAVASFLSVGQLVVVSMPRYLLGLNPGDKRMVTHINGNKLDCRRANIKIRTRSDVMATSETNVNNKSGYRGVSEVHSGAWRAQITISGASHYLGTFKDAKAASAAYRAAEKELKQLKKLREARNGRN